MKKWALSFLIFFSVTCWCQDTTALIHNAAIKNINYKQRQWAVGSLTVAGYGGSFLFLNQAWYKDFPHSSFHTFNDAGEWLQMDKIGHAWTAYHTSRLATNLWRWAGFNNNKALLIGTGSSLLYMISIEYLDGHSAEWGWSWGDAGADIFGAVLYAAEELGLKGQRISLKFSSHPKNYSEPDINKRADDLFGSSFQGRLLKDYNAQTYWLSANIKSFFTQTTLPAWLNISLGYGAEGMFGGYENFARSKTDGSVTFDRRDIKRYRQFYLAPD
ncbi:MAG: YfiM family protein, partial [Bacteroidota bacterium]|nr:YfiM family protein [Bacteroidota bacterium]